jgi:hypothetical protein
MSEMIFLADVTEDENDTLSIKVKKVLKGKDLTKGQVVTITNRPIRLDGSNIDIKKDVLVLFDEGWQEEGRRWPVFRSYAGEEADLAISLLKHASIKNERKRLKKLIKAYHNDNYSMRQLLLDEMGSMQDPKNFDIFGKAYHKITEADDLVTLLETMGETRDLRSLPILFSAMSSKHSEVKSTAAHELRYGFAGAPGVAEIFERHFDDPEVQYHAKGYLKLRYSHPKYQDKTKSETPWLKFKAYQQSGNLPEAKKACQANLQSDTWNSYSSFVCAEFLVNFTENHYDEIIIEHFIKPIPPLNELTPHSVKRLAQIAWQLNTRNDGILPLLLDLLAYKDYNVSIFALAVMSINSLDIESKTTAINHIYTLVDSIDSLSSIKLALGVSLLGNEEEIQKIKDLLYEKTYMRFAKADTYANIKQTDAPAAWIISELRKVQTNSKYIEWLIIHLSLLDDERTELVMYEMLLKYPNYDLQTVIYDVLAQQAELNIKYLITTLKSAQRHSVSTLTRLLIEHEGLNSLAEIRSIISGEFNGDVSLALSAIGRMGQVEDIAFLMPYCNNWPESGDRYNWQHCDALDSVRRHNHHDLNGPIVKSDKMIPLE